MWEIIRVLGLRCSDTHLFADTVQYSEYDCQYTRLIASMNAARRNWTRPISVFRHAQWNTFSKLLADQGWPGGKRDNESGIDEADQLVCRNLEMWQLVKAEERMHFDHGR